MAALRWAVMAFVEPPRFPQGRAEDVQGHGFAVPAAGLAVDDGGVLVGGDGLVELPCFP